jgi:hypothetical protein
MDCSTHGVATVVVVVVMAVVVVVFGFGLLGEWRFGRPSYKVKSILWAVVPCNLT